MGCDKSIYVGNCRKITYEFIELCLGDLII